MKELMESIARLSAKISAKVDAQDIDVYIQSALFLMLVVASIASMFPRYKERANMVGGHIAWVCFIFFFVRFL